MTSKMRSLVQLILAASATASATVSVNKKSATEWCRPPSTDPLHPTGGFVPFQTAKELQRFNAAVNALFEGVFRDLYSPDDVCADSDRIVSMGVRDADSYGKDKNQYALHVSGNATGDGCKESWGRAFHKLDKIDPTLDVFSVLNSTTTRAGEQFPVWLTEANITFRDKITNTSDPNYAYAQAGALDFTLKLGTYIDFDEKVKLKTILVWSGMYAGKGGPFFNPKTGKVIQSEPSDCANVWLKVGDLDGASATVGAGEGSVADVVAIKGVADNNIYYS